MFRTVLVANRGEIALRIIRAARELGIKTVAVYSEADRESPHLAEADRRVCIGGPRSADSYLNMEAILAAARQGECQALHPGYGFLAENALFAERCRQQKVSFVGPTPGAIRLMGDKIAAKQTMRQAGLEVIPGSAGGVGLLEEAQETAERVGYPVLLKATAGGGGKGMRVCRDRSELERNFAEAALEAEKAFGNPALYLEKFFASGRHIEFQVLADAHGGVVHLGERECSIQRSHQKLVEESPSPAISAERRARVGELVREAVRRIGYLGAGTVEFLMDPESGELYFMEMNTRLQVEHPVSEMVTGVDIVKEQFRIAANCRLSLRQEDITVRGHAIECRINAEDPMNGFVPSPGTIAEFVAPALGDSVRLDTHIRAPYTIPPFYDSLIAKLIAGGQDRAGAIETMSRALEQFRVEGVKTTIALHQLIMKEEVFQSGRYDTRFIDRLALPGAGQRDQHGA